MKKLRRLFSCIVILGVMFALAACGRNVEAQPGTAYEIYYVNNDETKIISRQYFTESVDAEDLFAELTGQLQTKPEKMEYQAPLAEEFSITGHVLDSGLLTVDFDEKYRELWGIREILIRAAIVRTLTQIEGIEYVSF